MSKVMQNLVVLMEREKNNSFGISSMVGNMCLNKFCIDEDAAFESSGVQYFGKFGPEKGKGSLSSRKMIFECFIDYTLETVIVLSLIIPNKN